MKKLRLPSALLFVLGLSSFDGFAQYLDNGQCCDPSSSAPSGDGPYCAGLGEPIDEWQNGADGVVDDCNCADANGAACTIPIDGGLRLLALAGGGLATAVMRRRREEEEAAAQGAA